MTSNTTTLPPYLQKQLAHIDDDQRSILIASAAVCLPLAWVAVALRFLARHHAAARYGSDDWTIIIALILGSAWIVDNCLCILFGGGRHMIFLLLQHPAWLISYGKNSIASEVMYNPSLFATKLSILLLYGRIFTNAKFHIGLWIVGSFTAAWTVCAIIVSLVQCRPLVAVWNPAISGTCVDVPSALTVFGALNIFTDIVILMMPISMVCRLHTNWSTKIQISGLFLSGTLVTVISIVRVVYTSQIDAQDPTWSETETSVWAIAEVTTALISACLPTYRPLFDKSKRKTSRLRLLSNTKDHEDIGTLLRKIHVHTVVSNISINPE